MPQLYSREKRRKTIFHCHDPLAAPIATPKTLLIYHTARTLSTAAAQYTRSTAQPLVSQAQLSIWRLAGGKWVVDGSNKHRTCWASCGVVDCICLYVHIYIHSYSCEQVYFLCARIFMCAAWKHAHLGVRGSNTLLLISRKHICAKVAFTLNATLHMFPRLCRSRECACCFSATMMMR